MPKLDSQQVSLIGRNLLVSELLQDGLEVARSERDRGIDLVAYLDLHETHGPFVACPLQVKASTHASFSIYRKYERFGSLLITYLWHVFEPAHFTAYCLSYPEAVGIADAMGWTATASWVEGGSYTTTKPSARLLELLERYRMGPGRWLAKVQQASP